MIETLLEVRNLSKTFRYRTGWFRRQTVEAVKPLSFTLREGQTLAIIGENGSGKSTLAKMLAGMIEPTSGELLIDDHPLHFGDYSFRSQRIRMIFQDPSTSLNPRQRISQILDFPLRLNTDLEPEQRRKQIIETMRMVGLLPDHVSYYPHMLAPGQKQRLGPALVALFFTIAFCSGIGTVGGAEAMSAVGTQESGTASALMGMSMFVFGGIAAPLSGIGGETLLKMSLAITVCYTLALLVALTRIDNQK
jgi:ABC-type lipoprotein export system ATPase subunit